MENIFTMDNETKQMYELLASFSHFSKQEIDELNDITGKQQIYHTNKMSLLEVKLENLRTQKKRIQVFLSISKMHILGTLPVVTRMEEFNPDELSRLQVQMNMNQADRSYAQELYKHAIAQQNNIEDQIKHCKYESENAIDYSLEEKRKEVEKQLDDRFQELIRKLRALKKKADDKKLSRYQIPESETSVQIGTIMCPINIHPRFIDEISTVLDQEVGNNGFTADLLINPIEGGCVCLESNGKLHDMIINVLISTMIEIGEKYGERINSILYVDPYLLNGSEIDVLVQTHEEKKSIIQVPQSKYQISEYIKKYKDAVKYDLSHNNNHVHLCVLHGFPEEYDAESLDIIREMCFNAERYRVVMILLNNMDSDKSKGIPHQAFPAQCINLVHGRLSTNLFENSPPAFIRFHAIPSITSLQLSLFQRYEQKENLDNRYDNRIKQNDISMAPKGTKKPINLPYAMSEHGEILKTNLNFGYLYGVQGSGKSTLLHTLISSIIATMHPDDVELWLVDFKMVEFSRYIRYCPPHVRRVILDSSPEMVFDLLDRLTNILNNRISRFDENHWHSIQDANRMGIYLPAIVVIIDEFPVMSHILSDAYEYREKLESLMTLGRQFGFFLLLSGQYYSTGLQGLKQEARNQMRWRAAMDGPKDEVKATLDLPAISEHDNSLITKIQSHYVLMKRIQDQDGNFLDYGKVLYFGSDTEGEKNQLKWMNGIISKFRCSSTYSQTDQNVYFDKQPAFFDGHSYVSFSSLSKLIREDIKDHSRMREAILCLYPGQPRCLKPLSAIELRFNAGENIFVCSRPQQIDELCSLLLSLVDSCRLNTPSYESTVIAIPKGENIYHLCDLLEQHANSLIKNVQGIREEIANIYYNTQRKIPGHKLLLLIDYPEIIEAIKTSYDESINTGEATINSPITNSDDDYADIFGSAPQHPGLLTRMLQGSPLDPIDAPDTITNPKWNQTNHISLLDMIDVILQNGSKYGYHVVPVFKTVQDCQAYRKISTHCSHMFFFKASKDDIMFLTKTREARYVEEMEPYTFRYVGDINGMSYRPYLHEGIEIDGWCQHGEIVERVKMRTGSYLE